MNQSFTITEIKKILAAFDRALVNGCAKIKVSGDTNIYIYCNGYAMDVVVKKSIDKDCEDDDL